MRLLISYLFRSLLDTSALHIKSRKSTHYRF